ncbi:MAG TPA: class I SAM-dependent methyltransferase, partial [Geobacteraceae bacterium]
RSYEPAWKVYSAHEEANLARARADRPLMVYDIVSSHADVKRIGRVLDFGGDDGNNISAFTMAERFVIDPSCTTPVAGVTKIADVGRRHPYDLIVCAHVLEHLVDPAGTLEFLTGSLSENGLIYVEVPYEVVLFLRGKPGINEHINVFSLASMKNLASSKGLDVVHAEVREYLYGAWAAKAVCCLLRKGGERNRAAQGLGAFLRETAVAAVAEHGIAGVGEIMLKTMWRQVRMRLRA